MTSYAEMRVTRETRRKLLLEKPTEHLEKAISQELDEEETVQQRKELNESIKQLIKELIETGTIFRGQRMVNHRMDSGLGFEKGRFLTEITDPNIRHSRSESGLLSCFLIQSGYIATVEHEFYRTVYMPLSILILDDIDNPSLEKILNALQVLRG